MLAGGEGRLPVKVDGDKHNGHLAHTVHGTWSGRGRVGEWGERKRGREVEGERERGEERREERGAISSR